MKAPLVAVDSLRRDRLEYMPEMQVFVTSTYDQVSASSTILTGDFFGNIVGEFTSNGGLKDDSKTVSDLPTGDFDVTDWVDRYTIYDNISRVNDDIDKKHLREFGYI